jgi:phospholipase C
MRAKKLLACATSALAGVTFATTPLLAQPALIVGGAPAPITATPIQHVVVIFQENISFDHYFGTYPVAANLANEPQFSAAPGTPSVNGLTPGLLNDNPNLNNPLNNNSDDPNAGGQPSVAANPFRLDRTQASTADQDHDYTPEQMAFDNGLMDLFPLSVGSAGPPPNAPPSTVDTTALTMGYYDGNTVTAMWNYAQNFAMNDNSFDTNFGPSTPGALNLISGQTNGAINKQDGTGSLVGDGNGGFTLNSDADPYNDVCSTSTGEQVQMTGTNIGDLLNAAHVTWGFFEGGFNLGLTNSNGTTGCTRSTTSAVTGVDKDDYIPHHEPFQYYASTANPTHARPTSVMTIGQTDAANHQYDIDDFFAAVSANNFPAVSFLKAPGFQDAHAGYSDPLDEQTFIVNTINFLQQRPEWRSTLVIISYDDSDGWYDHVMSPIMNTSTTADDVLTSEGHCGNGMSALPGVNPKTTHAQGRCGYGPRLPYLVISPWAKTNFVDHTLTDQTTTIHFIEDNWLQGERIGQGSFDAISGTLNNMLDFQKLPFFGTTLLLDPNTGERTGHPILGF